jgi:4'-phosphopantetheinyl transferase
VESASTQQPTLALGPAEVHLWLAFQHASPHDARLAQYASLLNTAEREQEARFYFERDRVRYRVTRAMVRCVLGAYLGITPMACAFENNVHGRPHLANAEAAREKLNFNLSHTQDLILLGVTRGRELGVDVERVTDRRASANLATRYFAPSESERILDAAPGERDSLFCQYWTLKESYIKARGKGMAIPLGKFGFELGEGGVKLWIDPVLGDDADRWSFMQLRPTESHHAAVCVDRAGEPVSLLVRDFAAFSLAPELPRG